MLGGSVAGRGNGRGPHKPLGLPSPWHPSSPKTTKLSLKIDVAPSRLRSRSLKWSCLGVWAPPGDLFIPPLEGGPQSRHTYIQIHSINTQHLWWKTGEKRQTYPSHARSTSSFLLSEVIRESTWVVIHSVLGLFHQAWQWGLLSNSAPAGLY